MTEQEFMLEQGIFHGGLDMNEYGLMLLKRRAKLKEEYQQALQNIEKDMHHLAKVKEDFNNVFSGFRIGDKIIDQAGLTGEVVGFSIGIDKDYDGSYARYPYDTPRFESAVRSQMIVLWNDRNKSRGYYDANQIKRLRVLELGEPTNIFPVHQQTLKCILTKAGLQMAYQSRWSPSDGYTINQFYKDPILRLSYAVYGTTDQQTAKQHKAEKMKVASEVLKKANIRHKVEETVIVVMPSVDGGKSVVPKGKARTQ